MAMKMRVAAFMVTLVCAGVGTAVAQQPPREPAPAPDSYDGHIAAAKVAAGFNFTGLLARVCIAPATPVGADLTAADRAIWYAEPFKVFDNLYWLGTKIHSSWALTDRDGIIILDTLFNYAAAPEIVDGLKKMHLDPKKIKYVIVTHGHSDHDQGAKLLQDTYGAHVVMGAPDWDMIAQGPDMPGGKPRRDMTGLDGQKITVGANTVTLVTTPGHTPGTLSMLFTVKDHGKPLNVAYSGGTSIAGIVHDVAALAVYSDSQRKLAKAAAATGASVILSNHSEFDDAYTKVRLMAARQPGEPHPFDVGADGVQRYFKVADECAQAARMKGTGY
jgi:metallo-beta-lactamase class B